MNTEGPIGRYRARVEELESLRGVLAKSGGTELGPVVGRVLEAAGDLLRRSGAVTFPEAVVDQALAAISPEGLRSWLDGTNVEEIGRRVARAADEAVEAALPDETSDGPTWGNWAMQGLLARDRLDSALEALQRLSKSRVDAMTLHTKLAAQVGTLDSKLKKKARWLTALNPERRAEAALLKDSQRAWWFSAFCDDAHDGLVRALGGEENGSLGKTEQAANQVVTQSRKRPVNFDELFRFDLGLSTPAEQAVIARQRKENPEFAKALAAMDEGERAIEELSGTRDNVIPVKFDAPRREMSSGSPEVVEDRADFQVLLFRRKERVQVVVHPRRSDRIAAAAVFLPDSPEISQPARTTAEGFEFDLGPEEKLRGQRARVVVRLQGGNSVTVVAAL